MSESLINRGIDREVAIKNVVRLTKTFTEDDLREITEYTSAEDFTELSDSLAEIIRSEQGAGETEKTADETTDEISPVPDAETPSDASDETVSDTDDESETPAELVEVVSSVTPMENVTEEKEAVVEEAPTEETSPDTPSENALKTQSFEIPKTDASEVIAVSSDVGADMNRTKLCPVVPPTTAEITQNTEPDAPQEIILGDESAIREKVKLTPRGKMFFWLILVLTSPITLTAAAGLLALFCISVLAVCIIIVLLIGLVLGEAALGCAGTLVGIIYGAIQIFGGDVGIGIYEIGLGIIIAGVSLALAILTYNLAAIAMPFVLKQLLTFWGYFIKRLVPVVSRFREECNRL